MARARSEEGSLKSPPKPAARKEPSPRAALPPDASGRVVVESLAPAADGGRAPIKRIVGDVVEISADIFTDGHDALVAAALYRQQGDTEFRRAPLALLENDRWIGDITVDAQGLWEYTVEAWRDPFASWAADARKKIAAAASDVVLVAAEGANLVARTAGRSPKSPLRQLADGLAACRGDTKQTFDLLLSEEATNLLRDHGPREDLSRGPLLLMRVDRERARFSAWYELFPRSAGQDEGRHGRFEDVVPLLPYVRDLGFDVLYFPPIHPIGTTNRKGKNNALKAAAGDVGSVYAIGAAEGGHDAIHPELGTLDDFRRLVAAAHAHGLEIALDFAVQCSPDHPWIRQHPDWFEWRPDGTIKFAENPPKKYEDIVNLRLSGKDYADVWTALRDVFLFWIEQGVRIFRVDNPHTKPIPFWRWLIADIDARHPDVIFLAEAFTRPKVMKALAKAGFQQSYTYFTWRNAKSELTEYVLELASDMGDYFRPNFFVNTPDINPVYLQTSGPTGFLVRATLAATLSSNWGMTSGFEFAESAPLPGREEYLDSEKYELRQRPLGQPTEIAAHIRRLNEIRRDNPALQDFRNVTFTNASNDQIIAYARMTKARDNVVFVMVNLDPHGAQEAVYELPLWEFGLADDASIEVEDLLLGIRFRMYGKTHTIRIDPAQRCAIVWRLLGPPRQERAA
jgi:starch synthase (maltosyl-transferring)